MANTELTRGSERDVQASPVRYETPRVEVSESESAIRLAADMPGVAPDGVSVELDDGVLSLEGAVQQAGDRPARYFRRRFNLTDPALFDVERISANMSNGVLEVEIPKAAKPEPRQIKINAV